VQIKDKISVMSRKIEEEVIKIRRNLHQYPELAFKEEKTAKMITEYLNRLGIEVHYNYENTTAVIGVIEGDKSGPTRALRAAMDGFGISEETKLPFSSKVNGCMHATGHDGLVAISLGVAHLLSQLKSNLNGRIVLIFQPAEEEGGGAKVLINKGLIEDYGIEMIFGFHISPELPPGSIGIRNGTVTSQSDRVFIEIIGKGAHAAKPDKAIDPIVIASHLILAYQEIISREISPYDFATISFGSIKAGSTYNAIPEEAILRGSIRTFSPKVQDYIEKRMKEMFNGITSTFRAKGKLDYYRFYPSVINHSQFSSNVIKWVEEIWPKQR
jgi:amidohydrolase